MQTNNRRSNPASRTFWLLLIIVCAIHFTGCVTPLQTRGIRKLNDIQINPSSVTHNKPKLNISINVNTRISSQVGYDQVLKKKLESSLINSLKNLNVFEDIQKNAAETADLNLSVDLSFNHKAFDDVQYIPIALLTLFIITPSHVETVGSAEVSINDALANFSKNEVFTADAIGRTLTGIAGHGDAVAKAVENICAKLMPEVMNFVISQYSSFEQIHIAKQSNTYKRRYSKSDTQKAKSVKTSGIEDTTPPELIITKPDLKRGINITAKEMDIDIEGIAKDSSGVVYVKVNDQPASLDAFGHFSVKVLLSVGENQLVIQAMDTKRNIQTKTLMVERPAFDIAKTEAIKPLVDVKSKAVLFGISDYKYWENLVNPVIDTDAIQNELGQNYGFEVQTVNNASKREILTKIRSLSKNKYKENEQLLIWFSGHGYFDELSKIGYIAASDSQKPSFDPIFETFIDYPKLMQIISNIPCKHILLIVDACFAGTLDLRLAMRGKDMYTDIPKEEYIKQKLKFKTRLYLTSGGKQYVPDGRPGQHSPFGRRFLRALRSYGGRDGILSFEEIVSLYMDKLSPQPRYNEFFGNEPGSSFIFIAK